MDSQTENSDALSDENEKQQSKKPLWISMGLLVALGLVLILFSDFARTVLFYELLESRTMVLVDGALESNGRAFLSISAIKGGVAVIEGSSVGVGFDLEVGDLVQPAHDYVDFVWKIFLWATAILMFYKLLLETGIPGIGIYIVALGLFLFAAAPIWEGQKRFLSNWGLRCVLVGLFVLYVIPVTLIASDLVARKYTEPVQAKQAERMESVQREFDHAKMDLLRFKESVSITDPGGSIENIRNSFMTMVYSFTRLTRQGMSAFLYYILITVFELLIMPFLTAIVLYTVLKLILERSIPQRVEQGRRSQARTAEA
ncbi:MAG: hypothetical protein ACLFUS_06590 [Candidatus Sumerlaeia bacterium]